MLHPLSQGLTRYRVALRPAKRQFDNLLAPLRPQYCRLHVKVYAACPMSSARARLAAARVAGRKGRRPRGIDIPVGLGDELELDVQAIEMTDKDHLEDAVGQFLRKYDPLWRALAVRYTRLYCTRYADLSDAVQVVRTAAFKLLLSGCPDDVPWLQAVQRRSKSEIQSWSGSGQETGLGNMTNQVRRHRSLIALKKNLNDPEADVIAEWNSTNIVRRKDPRRQGAIATDDDLIERQVLPEDPMSWAIGYDDSGLDAVADRSEAQNDITAVVEACRKSSAREALIAETWLVGSANGEAMSCMEIARRIGEDKMSRMTVLRLFPHVQQIARQVLADRVKARADA